WSLGPLGRDLATAYGARGEGREPGWAPLPVQYGDYTLWQRELLGDEADRDSRFSVQYGYWARQLADVPEHVTVPADRARPAVISYAGDFLEFGFGSELHGGVLEVARSSGATAYMVLQAALAALLTRLGAGTDIPVGCGVAGRTDDGLADLVGLFVNTLVLRMDTSGDPTFAELLGRVRETSLAAYTHQDIPFETLVEKLNPQRSASHHPLFQVALVLQNNAEARFDLPGLRIRTEEVGTGTSRYDLLLSLSETFGERTEPAGMTIGVEYSTDLFDAGTIRAFMARWERLLHAVVLNPERHIGDIDLLTGTERERLLASGGHGGEVVREATLPDLFQNMVRSTPTAAAVVDGRTSWSYGELNARANRVAHWLMGQGVGAERLVGVAMPRSTEQVAVVLGILKAGAAYLPVDPE
ncbi:condensation domain-containing protein, partial [Streptomyces sp. 2MCAF27]